MDGPDIGRERTREKDRRSKDRGNRVSKKQRIAGLAKVPQICYSKIVFKFEKSRENRERAMGGKRTGAQRQMCLLVIFILMFMGLRMEGIRAESCFDRPDFGTVSLQRFTEGQTSVLYRDTRTLSQLENFTALRSANRSLTGMRFGQWMALLLIPAALFLNFSVRERFLPFRVACENQYRRRTLDYIHHKDGKKA